MLDFEPLTVVVFACFEQPHFVKKPVGTPLLDPPCFVIFVEDRPIDDHRKKAPILM